MSGSAFFRCALAVAAATLVLAPATRAGEIVVIQSTVPGIAAGVIVDSADGVSLPAGTFIVVVEADGSTRTIEGPYDAPIGAAGEQASEGGLIANLGKLVADREKEKQVLGAIRAAPGQVAENLYVVNIGRSGTVCVPEGEQVVLWRPATMAAESEVRVSDEAGTAVRLLWPDGSQLLDWPDELAATDGDRYAIRLAIASTPVEIRLRRIPGDVAVDARRVEWMHRGRCVHQAERLLARMGRRRN